MEPRPRAHEKIGQLVNKGVAIPNPLTLDIGDEVVVDQISGHAVTIHPGCRIHGAATVISAGVELGREGPVTVEDCQLGPRVELKGGYFSRSVFLERANMGSGAQVRAGCIVEEEAGGAHCVGLKQTILFPFVTLGSLVNFCDCLMAGGTSRKNHSEVGSSFIHFNFTPDGNKVASLFGDVARGVMLDRPPIFLGGQGGAVGPVRLGYGTVVAAGSIVRSDVLQDNKMVIARTHRGKVRDFVPHAYRDLSRVVANTILYLANLVALEQWYRHVRQPFFAAQELGTLVHGGALDKLALARQERLTRLRALSASVPAGHAKRGNLVENIDAVCALFEAAPADSAAADSRDRFVAAFAEHTGGDCGDYLEAIRSLPPAIAQQGGRWLQQIIDDLCRSSAALLAALDLFPPLAPDRKREKR